MQSLALASKCNVDGVLILEHRRNGKLLRKLTMPNMEMDLYKALRANLRIAAGTAPSHIAIGTGTSGPTVGDTTLGAETQRAAATRSRVTYTITNDTSQYTYTFVISAPATISEAGLLNAATGGTLCYRRVFTGIPLLTSDTLKVTWRSRSTS